MENRQPHFKGEFLNDGETAMSAAEYLAQSLFDHADNDSQYHHEVSQVRFLLAHGLCKYTSEEIAERILAWSAAL